MLTISDRVIFEDNLKFGQRAPGIGFSSPIAAGTDSPVQNS